jgi:hypothetical protein
LIAAQLWRPLPFVICYIEKLVSYLDADLLHPATEGRVKKELTLGPVERDHIRVLHLIMALGAAAKVQQLGPRAGVRVGAKVLTMESTQGVLTMKSTQGNQTEIGLLASEPPKKDYCYVSSLLDYVCTYCWVLYCSMNLISILVLLAYVG